MCIATTLKVIACTVWLKTFKLSASWEATQGILVSSFCDHVQTPKCGDFGGSYGCLVCFVKLIAHVFWWNLGIAGKLFWNYCCVFGKILQI